MRPGFDGADTRPVGAVPTDESARKLFAPSLLSNTLPSVPSRGNNSARVLPSESDFTSIGLTSSGPTGSKSQNVASDRSKPAAYVPTSSPPFGSAAVGTTSTSAASNASLQTSRNVRVSGSPTI